MSGIYKDLFCEICLNVEGSSMYFAVYSLLSGYPEVLYVPKNGAGGTEKREEASILMDGRIKWDGCVDMDIGSGDSYRLHFCGYEDAKRVGEILKQLYILASKNIPSWDCGPIEAIYNKLHPPSVESTDQE